MSKKTILIVDDTFENLYLLRVILEEVGYHVIEANNGSEGLKKLHENSNVDLIISDILMPVMDGFMFCQACKEEKLFRNIPFVFYTSTYTEKLDEDFALKLGAAKYLRKPIDHDEVISTVNTIFGNVKPIKNIKQEKITNENVLKLYSERLINKLEQKSFDLEKEVEVRKQNEIALKEAKEYSEALLSSMHEGLVVFNLKTEITNVNPSFCKMSGFAEEELIGKQCPYPFSPGDIAEEAAKRHEKIVNGEPLESFETIYERKNGMRFNVHVNISNVFDNDGKRVAYFGTIQDTTIRKKAEIDLKLAKDFTDKLVMSMQEGLIIVDLEGKIIMINNSTCKILGYKREELIGMELPYPFAKIEDFQKISETNKKVAKGDSPSFQFEFIKKNGEHFLASFLTGNITNDKGEVIALFGTMKDVSDEEKAKKLLEENARKSNQKKEVILELASLVGEDFKASLKKITKLASQTLNINRVSVWSFNEDKSKIYCENLYNLIDDAYKKGAELSNEDNPNYFQALKTKQTLLINDAQ